jgi:glycosyltransferase involved in cell wall biosynthesis
MLNRFNLNTKTTISCVIPAYNEGKNISRVLDVVTTYSKFNEIIVIDDGSKDNTREIVKEYQKNCEHLKLIVNSHNLGKTGAIKKAVYMSSGELVVMLDADLINLNHRNLNALIKPVQTNKCGMTILDRAGDKASIMGFVNLAKFFGGERCILKKDFELMNLPKNGGYLLEVIMNMYYIGKGKKIQTIYCKNLYTIHQFSKIKFWKGIRNYLKMFKKIWNAASLFDFVRQIVLIRDDRYNKLFDIYDKRGKKTKPVRYSNLFNKFFRWYLHVFNLKH